MNLQSIIQEGRLYIFVEFVDIIKIGASLNTGATLLVYVYNILSFSEGLNLISDIMFPNLEG